MQNHTYQPHGSITGTVSVYKFSFQDISDQSKIVERPTDQQCYAQSQAAHFAECFWHLFRHVSPHIKKDLLSPVWSCPTIEIMLYVHH